MSMEGGRQGNCELFQGRVSDGPRTETLAPVTSE